MTQTKSIKPELYFVGPKTDFLFIGGLSLLLFPVLWWVQHSDYFSSFLISLFYLGVIINFPHFSATVFRLYRSKENMMAFPVTSFVIPIVVLALTLAAFFLPQLFASVFILVYFFWSPYHFSGQSTGVTMVYARRNNYRIGKIERLFLSGFIFSSFLFPVLWLLGSDKTSEHSDLEPLLGYFSGFFDIQIPEWTSVPVGVFLGISAVGFVILMMKQAREKGDRFPPLMLFLPAITHFIWFAFSAEMGALAFIALVPLFHSLQYLYIAWAVQLKELHKDQAPNKKQAFKDSLSWYGWNVMGGALQFLFLPMVFVKIFDVSFFYAFLIVSTGVQVHHFFVDGVIWKLRNPNALAALTSNIPKWVQA